MYASAVCCYKFCLLAERLMKMCAFWLILCVGSALCACWQSSSLNVVRVGPQRGLSCRGRSGCRWISASASCMCDDDDADNNDDNNEFSCSGVYLNLLWIFILSMWWYGLCKFPLAGALQLKCTLLKMILFNSRVVSNRSWICVIFSRLLG